MSHHVYLDKKPDGTPFYVGIGNAARVKNVQRNSWHRAIRLRYPDWTRTVVETASRALCMEFEELIISEIGRRDLGTGTLVNFTSGGEGSPTTIVSADTRKKQSEAHKGVAKSPEWRAKISASHMGKVVSPATGLKISASKRGVKMPDAHRISTSKAVALRWEDPEYALKMADMTKRNWSNPEFREKVAASQRRAQGSPERREANRAKSTEVWKDPVLCEQARLRTAGTIWMNTDGTSKRVFPVDIDTHLTDGWKRGRK